MECSTCGTEVESLEVGRCERCHRIAVQEAEARARAEAEARAKDDATPMPTIWVIDDLGRKRAVAGFTRGELRDRPELFDTHVPGPKAWIYRNVRRYGRRSAAAILGTALLVALGWYLTR